MDALGDLELRMVDQLCSPEQERQEMIIIQPPNSMTSCRFQHVLELHLPHQVDIPIEKFTH